MDGDIPINVCKKDSGRSGASFLALVLVVGCFILICTVITMVCTNVYLYTSMRDQIVQELQESHQNKISELEKRVGLLETRCKQTEVGIPESGVDLEDIPDDISVGEIPTTTSHSIVKGDYGGIRSETSAEHKTSENDATDVIHKRAAPKQGIQGERGERGKRGHRGERGPRGERGKRGPPGNCSCPTNTPTDGPSTGTPTPTMPPATTLAPQSVSSASLVAQFEGKRDTTVESGANETIDRYNHEFVTFRDGWIPHWRYARWMEEFPDLKRKFHLHHRHGKVQVMEEGIYYVYSQMLYHKSSSTSVGHSIIITRHNHTHSEQEVERITCLQNSIPQTSHRNTCYIARLVRISHCDHVGIQVTYDNTIIDLGYEKSFWGFIKVADLNTIKNNEQCPHHEHRN